MTMHKGAHDMTTAAQPVIDLKGIELRRGGKTILHGLNWQVNPGEHWVVLGLNGSGKTTMLNVVTGYLWPSGGEVRVLGEKYGTVDLREHRKRIGWVSSSFQERVHGQERGLDLVVSGKFASIGLYEKPSAEDYEYAGHLLDRFGCPHLKDQPYALCSQGEKQKLLIARALMARPELLILDEPCNGLDFLARERLLADISRLAEEPGAPALIYVTHHIEEIVPAFTHVLMLKDGTVFRSGPSADMLDRETLETFFGVPLEVIPSGGRAWLRMLT